MGPRPGAQPSPHSQEDCGHVHFCTDPAILLPTARPPNDHNCSCSSLFCTLDQFAVDCSPSAFCLEGPREEIGNRRPAPLGGRHSQGMHRTDPPPTVSVYASLGHRGPRARVGGCCTPQVELPLCRGTSLQTLPTEAQRYPQLKVVDHSHFSGGRRRKQPTRLRARASV
jgi:hypothetical protein